VRRCALLLADAEGALRLADLRRGEPDQARSSPVRGLPRLLAVHERSRTLGIIVDLPGLHSVLRCLRPGKGAQWALIPAAACPSMLGGMQGASQSKAPGSSPAGKGALLRCMQAGVHSAGVQSGRCMRGVC
jgi:hypothetical protein